MANEKWLIDANAKLIEKHFTKRLIDGYALVDVIEDTDWYHVNEKGELVDGANSAHNTPLYKASDIYQAIANAPTVDAVEVVHGEWIVCGDGDYVPFMCSHCGKTTAYQYKIMYGKYCPNCGAKMDGEGNG